MFKKGFYYFMKWKGECFAKFMEFKAFVESQFGKRIKILQNDNGGECFSKKFKDFMWNMESNIKHLHLIGHNKMTFFSI